MEEAVEAKLKPSSKRNSVFTEKQGPIGPGSS
jgi:hypothetical protein